MIEYNQNIIRDNSIKRTVHYNGDEKQITFLDSRYYHRNNKYYPSVTYVLSYIPKEKIFIDWLKEKGEESDVIVDKASKKGKRVHGAIESLLNKEELSWIDAYGNANYSLEEWQMILKFSEFWTIHQPTCIGSEIHTFSDKYEYAGTIDLILDIKGETWLIDLKTSNQIPPVYHYQTAAYAMAWNECYDKPIDRRGILWLKSYTRKEDKTGKKIQGKGWQLIESDRSLDDDFKSFQLFYDVYKHQVTYNKPLSEIFPTTVKIM